MRVAGRCARGAGLMESFFSSESDALAAAFLPDEDRPARKMWSVSWSLSEKVMVIETILGKHISMDAKPYIVVVVCRRSLLIRDRP